ncbi:MAG TPA: PKD domain-containing protein [Chitinophagaceae bacterium]
MKKLFYFFALLWSCAYLLPLYGQADSSCRAAFTFGVNANKVNFYSSQGLPAGTTHWWTFGDASSSPEANPVHNYAAPGTYWVTHYILNQSSNCKDSVVRAVTITEVNNCTILPKFTWKRDSINCKKILFINQSVPISTTAHFIWKFGDGTTSNEVNPSHTYAQEGVYNVCLVMEYGNGCRKEFCQQVEVRCQTTCNLHADFSWKRDSVQHNKVYFKSIVLSPVAAMTFKWTFGDGTTSTDPNPTHVYQQPGTYRVCLRVAASNTCVAEVCKEVNVQAQNDCDVRAKFTWKRDASHWNKIWFANLSYPVQNIWRTYWSYGDGTTSQDFNSFHVYQQPGKYYVCLKVQSLNGCISTFCDSVIVRRADSCENRSDFRFEVSGTNLLEYHFKPKYVNQSWKYLWSFGDGTTSTAIAPVHKYAHAGAYKVCLTVRNGDSCRTTTCKEIRVALNCDEVKLKFEYRRDPQKPYIISFHAVSNMPVIQQKWTIMKLSNVQIFPPPLPVILNADNPTYTFRDSGWYLVCLYAITSNNCKKTWCEKIYIKNGENGRYLTSTGIPVYPNPATRLVRLDVQTETATLLTVRVLDGLGTPKIQFTSPARAGNNNLVIPVEKLSSGMYVVEIRYGNQVKLAKFQKG